MTVTRQCHQHVFLSVCHGRVSAPPYPNLWLLTSCVRFSAATCLRSIRNCVHKVLDAPRLPLPTPRQIPSWSHNYFGLGASVWAESCRSPSVSSYTPSSYASSANLYPYRPEGEYTLPPYDLQPVRLGERAKHATDTLWISSKSYALWSHEIKLLREETWNASRQRRLRGLQYQQKLAYQSLLREHAELLLCARQARHLCQAGVQPRNLYRAAISHIDRLLEVIEPECLLYGLMLIP